MLAVAFVLTSAVCSLGASPKTSTGKVSTVRFWSLGDMTRVAIDVSAGFKFKSERLTNPDRLFFDIEGSRSDLVSKGVYTIAVGDSILKQIRIAETTPGVTRIVLDLTQHAEYTASQLSGPDRLMIELRGKDKPAPAVITETVAPIPVPREVTHPINVTDAPPVVAKKFEPPPHTEVATVQKPLPPFDVLLPPTVSVNAKPTRPPSPPLSAMASSLPPAPRVVGDVGPDLPTRSAPSFSAEPAKRNTNGDRSLTRVLGLKLGRVVIDPGHGGKDVGTHGPSGLYEKDVVLDVSRRLGALIEARLGSEVIYTRSDDTFIPLEERPHLANERKADLFLSIHANSSSARSAAGVEMYYLNFTTSKEAMDTAARENAGSSKSISDLKDLLQKIALKDKIDESREFASRLQTSLNTLESKQNATSKNRGVKRAPFIVLIGTHMPSVLAEIGFLTNGADEAMLRKPEYREKLAEALYKGIANYAETLSHFQVAHKE